ncbi:hypothetical protein V5P93_003901 [Actinokineospora auranticolor]|uniref:hypothetical protein n=1 Tax=Actinokineospora auranticolor TaxID=155976 RepID=UPI0011B0AD59|nr:hypothetical protein [Actinokineospora auranticolor]
MTEPDVIIVRSADGQYRLEDAAPVRYRDAWPPPQDGMTTGEEQWFAVLTGMEWGPLNVGLDLRESAPAAIPPGWEAVTERRIHVTSSALHFLTTSLDLVHELALPTAGWWAVRVHVTGRMSRRPKEHSPDGLEEHLLQLWPVEGDAPPRLLVGPDAYGELLM